MNTKAFVIVFFTVYCATEPENVNVKPPTKCEVCKLFAYEFMLRYNATASSALLANKIPYSKSELRLTEIMEEPNLCVGMLEYRLHNERNDSTRFQKSRPQTFETLMQLVNRGVDVKMDIPQALWDSPSLEISLLKEQCEKLVAEYESAIEEWFFERQDDTTLIDYLCRLRMLKGEPSECLEEPMPYLNHGMASEIGGMHKPNPDL